MSVSPPPLTLSFPAWEVPLLLVCKQTRQDFFPQPVLRVARVASATRSPTPQAMVSLSPQPRRLLLSPQASSLPPPRTLKILITRVSWALPPPQQTLPPQYSPSTEGRLLLRRPQTVPLEAIRGSAWMRFRISRVVRLTLRSATKRCKMPRRQTATLLLGTKHFWGAQQTSPALTTLWLATSLLMQSLQDLTTLRLVTAPLALSQGELTMSLSVILH